MTNKLLILTLLFITCDLYAQKIENVHAELQGKKINIYYDITGAKSGQTFDVRIYCSTDGGSTWRNPLYYVTGDAGKGIKGGYNKKIVWDVLKDMEKLVGDKIQFEIRARVIGGNTFTDARDGQTYKTVKTGAQVWMAENLNYNTSSSWCYKNKSSNCDIYGRLYNWKAAKNACPSGWHLPTDNEWTKLTDHLGGKKVAGGKMKSASYWKSPNTGATNESGFNALPGGRRNSDDSFHYRGRDANFWVSTPGSSGYAWGRNLNYVNGKVYCDNWYRSIGFSVRCLRGN